MSGIDWNYDIEAAKKMDRVLACVAPSEKTDVSDTGEKWVGWTRWLEGASRWEMIGAKQTILCWVKPEHPLEDPKF